MIQEEKPCHEDRNHRKSPSAGLVSIPNKGFQDNLVNIPNNGFQDNSVSIPNNGFLGHQKLKETFTTTSLAAAASSASSASSSSSSSPELWCLELQR
jgi:hypothetical protein